LQEELVLHLLRKSRMELSKQEQIMQLYAPAHEWFERYC
jgi:hypothetical protein